MNWSESIPNGLLLSTTVILLVLSRVALPVFGFETTKRLVASSTKWCPPYRTQLEPDRISWAVNGVSSRLPLSFTCLMKALVGQSLFAANGHQSALQFGVAKDSDDELQAHAWVERGGSVVIGELHDLSKYQLIEE